MHAHEPDDPDLAPLGDLLRPLDPSRSPARWEHAIQQIVAREQDRRAQRLPAHLIHDGRYALLLASAAALLVWLLGAPARDPPLLSSRLATWQRWLDGDPIDALDLLHEGGDDDPG